MVAHLFAADLDLALLSILPALVLLSVLRASFRWAVFLPLVSASAASILPYP